MATTYRGVVRDNVVMFSEVVRLPDGIEVIVVVPKGDEEFSEDAAWEALSAEAWAQDWVERDSELVKEETKILDLFPWQGQWTEADYLALPETNRIIELSEGWVVIPDMPTTAHQRTVGKLFRLMADYVEAHGLGEVCIAPLPVRLWPGKIREPDIIFMNRSHADRIGEDYWGVPDLVVEVISPRTPKSSGTEQVDREEKSVEYARAGVQEYWIIHPTACTVEVYVLRNGLYHLLERWGVGEVARSQVLKGFEVPVEAVIQGGE